MAISKSVISILQGMGTGTTRGGKSSSAPPVAVNTMTITFPQPLNCGMCRIQAKGFTGGGGFVSASLRGTDGTNFWDLAYMAPAAAGAAGDFISILLPFICDGNLTSVTVALNLTAATTGGTPAGGTVDAEVWGASM